MIRRVIQIEEDKCNGCGACAKACHEGAIGMVNGKAKLMRDDYCDGLGDCLPACPMDAIHFIEREAEAYDEAAVLKNKEEKAKAERSRLRQWPVQIKLLPVHAPFYEGANLLIAADCTAYAYAKFHDEFLKNRVVLVGCPKLDSTDYAVKLAEIIRQNNIGFVVALGGGSPMDCAKAAASVALTQDSIRKYHGTGVALPAEHLPLIAIPTTAGTGSEVTCVSVLSDHANGKKAPIVSEGFYPAAAIIDPELTYTMPPAVTAGTGIDVLSHAIEGYWSKGHQPICDTLAIHAAALVFKYLYRAYENPSDEEAREKMCEASVIAGLAFTLPKTTSSHACSFPLTNIYHIPHGEACGLTLDYFVRINARGTGSERVETLAKALGFADAEALADAIFALKQKLGLRCDLKDLHLEEEQIAELVKISRHPNLYNNPVEITDEMLDKMYRYLAN